MGFYFFQNMTIEQLYELFLNHPAVSTDSRNIENGGLFFALKGPNFDGNKYAADSLSKGAAFSIVDDNKLPENPNFIMVEDVLQTLQELASYHRKSLGIPILGITGSNGKTTTKELIVAILRKKYNVSSTKGNLNNHIGVPLTLLEMNRNTDVGIVEMGANHPGEIAELCQIANPDFGLITNIGKAHLEGFGSFEGIIKTKSELYKHLKQKSGSAFIHIDNEILQNQAQGLELLTYGRSDQAQLRGELHESAYYLTVKALFPKGWLYLKSKLIGAYNFENILAAARIGLHFKVDPIAIQDAVANYSPMNNRSQLVVKGKNKIIMDAYNANPTSMAASLSNFDAINQKGKMVILGDMLELGDQTDFEHQKIVDILGAMNLDKIFLVGKEFAKTSSDAKTKKFETVELLSDYLRQQKETEINFTLIKGSRGIKLERILETL